MLVFRENGGCLEWCGGHEVVRVEPWGEDSVRVRVGLTGLRDDVPGALLERSSRGQAEIEIDDDRARVRAGRLTAEVVQRNAEVTIPFLFSSRGYGLLWNCPAIGRAVAPIAGSGWITFRDVDFGGGVGALAARVARAAPGRAALRARLDDPAAGPVVATLEAPGTGDRYAWTTVRAPVREAAGVHDQRLASFRSSR